MTVLNHGTALRAVQPLPGGVVAGQRQVRRHGALIVTASLEPSRFPGEWEGIRIRIVSRSAGELDSNVFLFVEHGTLPDSGTGRIAAGDALGVEGGVAIRGARLAKKVAEYIAAF